MQTSEMRRIRTADMAHIAMFVAVMAICAWIAIPGPVPFTLQTFGVFLTAGVLGGKKGSLAVLIYLLLGMVGAPVFAGFTGGIGHILSTTGGYIVGFLFSALVMWAMEGISGKKKGMLAFSMILGLLVCYGFGTAWYMYVYMNQTGAIGLLTALSRCVFPYVIPDGIKIALALILCGRLGKAYRLN